MRTCNICGRGLIIEGVPGAGKSTAVRLMRDMPRFRSAAQPSVFSYSEEITQRVLEKAWNTVGLTTSRNREHLLRILRPLEQINDLIAARGWANTPRHGFLYLLERFHLTHAAYYPHVSWRDVEDIDARLCALGARMVIVTLSADGMRRRILAERNPGWRRYVSRYGSTNEEIMRHYRKRQETLLSLAERSHLQTLVVNGERDPRDVAGRILDFWIPPDRQGSGGEAPACFDSDPCVGKGDSCE